MQPSHPHPSLVITRNFSQKAEDTQTYMPTRYIRGLLPDALLEDYVFWQETDDSLTGYLRKDLQDRAHTLSVLRVQLIKDAGLGATARVLRVPVKSDQPSDKPAAAPVAAPVKDTIKSPRPLPPPPMTSPRLVETKITSR